MKESPALSTLSEGAMEYVGADEIVAGAAADRARLGSTHLVTPTTTNPPTCSATTGLV